MTFSHLVLKARPLYLPNNLACCWTCCDILNTNPDCAALNELRISPSLTERRSPKGPFVGCTKAAEDSCGCANHCLIQSLLMGSDMVQAQLTSLLSKMARSNLVACVTLASLTKASAMLLEATHGVRWHSHRNYHKYSSNAVILSLLQLFVVLIVWRHLACHG